MNITVLVNDVALLLPTQTTALLAHAASCRGHDVSVASVDDLSWSAGGLRARRRALRSSEDVASSVRRCLGSSPAIEPVRANDLVLIRTNPGREEASAARHGAALALLSLARRRGIRVLNDPDVLVRMHSKLNTLDLPDSIRPRGIVSSDAGELRRFVVDEGGPCVLKPLAGTRGRGVHLVQHGSTPLFATPLDEAIAELCAVGPVLAQAWVPGAEHGDTRVILLDGRRLEVGDRVAAVRRIPAATDFRSNIALGSAPAAARWTGELDRVVEAAGPWLRRAGVWLAGLDVIGDRVIEVNVFSPGGLRDAGRLEGVDFSDAIVERIERRFESAGGSAR